MVVRLITPAPGVGDAVWAAADVGGEVRLLSTVSRRMFGDRLGDSVGASDHVFFGSWMIFLGKVPGFKEDIVNLKNSVVCKREKYMITFFRGGLRRNREWEEEGRVMSSKHQGPLLRSLVSVEQGKQAVGSVEVRVWCVGIYDGAATYLRTDECVYERECVDCRWIERGGSDVGVLLECCRRGRGVNEAEKKSDA